MRIVVQRVNQAAVRINGTVTGEIGKGLVLLIGIKEGDTMEDVDFWADKCLHLRVFEDETGKMNLSLTEAGGAILAISQFTLYGDARKGRRPSFIRAARPEVAEPLYNRFVERLKASGTNVATGVFGAMMEVEIHNWGPVTIILEP